MRRVEEGVIGIKLAFPLCFCLLFVSPRSTCVGRGMGSNKVSASSAARRQVLRVVPDLILTSALRPCQPASSSIGSEISPQHERRCITIGTRCLASPCPPHFAAPCKSPAAEESNLVEKLFGGDAGRQGVTQHDGRNSPGRRRRQSRGHPPARRVAWCVARVRA